MTCHCLESGRLAKKLRQRRQCRNTILSYVTLHVNKNNTKTKYPVSNLQKNFDKMENIKPKILTIIWQQEIENEYNQLIVL